MSKEMNVLFLDDEEHILSALKRTFMDEPFAVAVTSDADEAMDILAREKIKVAVSDQRMPHVSGVEFLKGVKEKHPNIVRILFTGYTDFATVEDAINLSEAYRFITKPWNIQELKGIIRQAMEHYDLVTENRRLFEATQAKNIELETLNKKLKVMYELQKEFTSTVSHELRTPLASIKTAIDILIAETPGKLNADQKKMLDRAERNVVRLRKLIDDVLDLNKIESGKVSFDFQSNDLNKVIRESADLNAPMIEKAKLSIKLKLDPSVPLIVFDREKIMQVLNNLIGNAVKFTREGGVFVISTHKKKENHVVVGVKDTGVGIKEEDFARVFEKFQQLGDPTMRSEGGTGLGLSICREIVLRHGGKIWVESEYGNGSTFFFILPINERRRG